MAKFTHYITVPMTAGINVSIETDSPIDDDRHAFDLAMQAIDKLDVRINVTTSDNEKNAGMSAEMNEIDYHQYLNRGNVCYAIVPEITWESEESE